MVVGVDSSYHRSPDSYALHSIVYVHDDGWCNVCLLLSFVSLSQKLLRLTKNLVSDTHTMEHHNPPVRLRIHHDLNSSVFSNSCNHQGGIRMTRNAGGIKIVDPHVCMTERIANFSRREPVFL